MPTDDKKRAAHKILVTRVLEGEGKSTHAQRRNAFENTEPAPIHNTLINKVAKHAYKLTDQDIAAAKASGLNEDQIFELVVCAAIGQATRQYQNGLAALDAIGEE